MKSAVTIATILCCLLAGCLPEQSATIPVASRSGTGTRTATFADREPASVPTVTASPRVAATPIAVATPPATILPHPASGVSPIISHLSAVMTFQPTWWCSRGDGATCSDGELADPIHYRQILLLPTGFTSDDYETFRTEFQNYIASVNRAGDSLYAGRFRDKILYIGYWMPGGALGTDGAVFGGKIADHPIRGKALTLRQDDVLAAVDEIGRDEIHQLSPAAVMVIFNSTLTDKITANAAPPSVINKPFGIGKVTRTDIAGDYVPVHEMAHASLNFLDEYTEPGLDSMNISSLDYLTPLAVLDSDWGNWLSAIQNLLGVYSYRISEILAANGADNVDVTQYPSRVSTPGYNPRSYDYEGGMFFGHGTYHDRGKNIMNDDNDSHGADDGFDYAHSASQWEVVDEAFVNPGVALRPNDRIRNAGPLTDWGAQFGSTTHVMLYDGDKLHHWHPTQSYTVQVGWYDRQWKTCWALAVPYPCYDDVWTTAQKVVAPERRTLSLNGSTLYGLAQIAQEVLCDLGVSEIKSGSGTFNLCAQSLDQMSGSFVPTMTFGLPYQDVSVPADQWFTTYYWRFKTSNGTMDSGYTAWATFYRVF